MEINAFQDKEKLSTQIYKSSGNIVYKMVTFRIKKDGSLAYGVQWHSDDFGPSSGWSRITPLFNDKIEAKRYADNPPSLI